MNTRNKRNAPSITNEPVVAAEVADAKFGRYRRVVIEEDQRRKLDHARLRGGYSADVNPHSHDRETFRLINQRKDLDALRHADYVVPKLDLWKSWEKMNDWDSKNRLLEGLVTKLRRREASDAEIQLLITLCTPAWSGVTANMRRFGGVELDPRADGIDRREETFRVNDMDRRDLDQTVQMALMETLYSTPRPFPYRFFPWLRETLAFRVLDQIRDELTQSPVRHTSDPGIEEVLSRVLIERPAPGSPRFTEWIRSRDISEMFDLAREFAPYSRARKACERAVDRLPKQQREVIRKHYFEAMTQEEIALTRGVAGSTVRNTHASALGNLRRDDELFIVLEAVGQVRDRDRKLAVRTETHSELQAA